MYDCCEYFRNSMVLGTSPLISSHRVLVHTCSSVVCTVGHPVAPVRGVEWHAFAVSVVWITPVCRVRRAQLADWSSRWVSRGFLAIACCVVDVMSPAAVVPFGLWCVPHWIIGHGAHGTEEVNTSLSGAPAVGWNSRFQWLAVLKVPFSRCQLVHRYKKTK